MNFQKAKIAIVSPSWCGPEVFPQVYESGIEQLKLLGFTIQEYPSTRKSVDYKQKAEDINAAFRDPTITGIIASIGGDDSINVLEYLDLEAITNNPKPVMGYSDTTTFLAYLAQLGIPTYHGPTVMAGFAQFAQWENQAQQALQTALFTSTSYTIDAFTKYAEGYKDWASTPNELKEGIDNPGYTIILGGNASGQLWGGCIEVLEFMKGTRFWPEEHFFRNKVLFLETSEDKPTPKQVQYMFRNYGTQGILEQVSAVLFGRPRDYTLAEKEELDQLLKLTCLHFNRELTLITGLDFGHTDPQYVLPYNAHVKIDNGKITIDKSK